MWPSSHFRRDPFSDPEDLTRLSCILHFLARRHDGDEGFILTTQNLSTREFEYFTRTPVSAGEILRVKIVSGPHVLDVRCAVQTVMAPGETDYRGLGPRMSFMDLSDYERRVLYNMIARFRASVGTEEAGGA